MENSFKGIQYGKGTRPLCKFTLSQPIKLGVIGNVYRIDAALSEDGSRIDVWLVSEENGRLFYNAIRKKVPQEMASELNAVLSDVVNSTKEHTKNTRSANYINTDELREELKRVVSDVIRKKVYEHLNGHNYKPNS